MTNYQLTTSTKVETFKAVASELGVTLIFGDARKKETKLAWIKQIEDAEALVTGIKGNDLEEVDTTAKPEYPAILKALDDYTKSANHDCSCARSIYDTLYNGIKNEATVMHLGEFLAEAYYEREHITVKNGNYVLTEAGLQYLQEIEMMNNETRPEPTKIMLLIALAAAKYNRKVNQSMADYLTSKFCNMYKINQYLMEMLHDDGTIYINQQRDLELNSRGETLISEFMKSAKRAIVIADGSIVGSISYDEYRGDVTTANARNLACLQFRRYKVYAFIMGNDARVGIGHSVGDVNVDHEEICRIIKSSNDEYITANLSFWEEYQKLFGDDLLIY